MRRRLLASVLAGASLVGAPGVQGGLTEVSTSLDALWKAVTPRRGVAHRHLAVVPLVRTDARHGPADADAAAIPSQATWTPSPRPGASGRVGVRGAPPPPKVQFLPFGIVLERDLGGPPALAQPPEERLTLSPTLLVEAGPVLIGTLPCGGAVPAKPTGPEPPGRLGLLPPIEVRRSAFGGATSAALEELLTIEGAAAGLDPGAGPATLASLRALRPERVDPAEKDLSALATAYGGEVMGHAVFLGNRLVEVVVGAAPSTYRSVLAAERRALAVSAVLWEDLEGRDGPLVPEVDWAATVAETARVLAALAAPSLRPERRDDAVPAAGRAWRVQAATRPGRTPTEIGWLVTDAADRAVWLEVWPEAAVGPLPPPAAAPGEVPPEDGAQDRKQGWIGRTYLERKIRQLQALDRGGALEPRIQRLQRLLDGMTRGGR